MPRIVDGWVLHDKAKQRPQRQDQNWQRPKGPRRRRWVLFVVAAVVIAMAVHTNPGRSEESFRQFLRAQRSFALTHRLAEAAGLIEVRMQSLWIAAVGWEAQRTFVGAFDQWVELPSVAQLPVWAKNFGRSFSLSCAEERDVDVLLFIFLTLFAFWQLAPQTMARHCAASWANMRAGRIWSLVGAQVSHAQVEHLLVNALFLYSVAPQTHAALGRRRFWVLYFLGGGCGVVSSMVLSPLFLRGRPFVEHVGSSGPLFALLGYIAGIGAGIRWLGREWRWTEFIVAQLLLGLGTGTDTIAHIGGAIAGWAAAQRNLLEQL